MSQVEFELNGYPLLIKLENNEKMKEAINKFITKTGEINYNLLFLYNGNIIEEEITFSEQANDLDKLRNKMNLIVIDNKKGPNIINQKKSKNIICPEFHENIIINIDKNKI